MTRCRLVAFWEGYFAEIVGLCPCSLLLNMDFVWCLVHLRACYFVESYGLLQLVQHSNFSAAKFSSLWTTFDCLSHRSSLWLSSPAQAVRKGLLSRWISSSAFHRLRRCWVASKYSPGAQTDFEAIWPVQLFATPRWGWKHPWVAGSKSFWQPIADCFGRDSMHVLRLFANCRLTFHHVLNTDLVIEWCSSSIADSNSSGYCSERYSVEKECPCWHPSAISNYPRPAVYRWQHSARCY